ncbi:MAG: carbohydrate ABC transporter permease [Beijerinckiaceae bacterium]
MAERDGVVNAAAQPGILRRWQDLRAEGLSRDAAERLFHAALIAPAVIVTAALIVWPLWFVLRTSFHELRLAELMRPLTKPVTLANFTAIVGHESFWPSVETTAIFVACGAGLAFIIGLLAALALDRAIPARGALRLAVMTPWAVAPVVASIAWAFLLDERFGLINYIALQLGLIAQPAPFLTDPSLAVFSTAFVFLWKAFPFHAITLLAGLRAIPPNLYEAARIDGAGPLMRFWTITLPLLKPFALVALFLGVLTALREVETILVLTGGGPARATETLALKVYLETFRYLQPGRGAAAAVILLLVGLVIGAIVWRPMSRRARS